MFLNFFVHNILCFSFPFVYGAKYEPHLLWELPKSSCLLLIFSLTKDFNIFFYYRGLRVDQTRDHWSRASLMFPIKASIVIGQQIQLNLKQLWLLQHQHEKSNSKRVINPKNVCTRRSSQSQTQGTEICTLCPLNVTTVTDLTWKVLRPNNGFRLSRANREMLWRVAAQRLTVSCHCLYVWKFHQ